MRPVRVVTDSTSYLPASLAAQVGVIPLQVILGEQQRTEGIDVTPAEIAAALRSGVRVSTSLPSPVVTDEVLTASAGDVCVVHISSVLSGTCAATAARVAELGLTAEVIDSRLVTMGLGFVALAAAEAAASGLDLEAVRQAALDTIDKVSAYFVVDTLEHLRRGGRLTASQSLLGTALSIKPILELRDGAIVAKEKVRTSAKALARMEDLVVEAAAGGPVRLAVHHLDAAAGAEAVAERLGSRLELVGEPIVSEVGAVVGAHTGPGLIGAVICR